jgi:hypothetical protein
VQGEGRGDRRATWNFFDLIIFGMEAGRQKVVSGKEDGVMDGSLRPRS